MYNNILDLLENSCKNYPDKAAFGDVDGDLTFTVYADYDFENGTNSRTIQQVAYSAFNDRATEQNGATTYNNVGAYKITDTELASDNGAYSPYNKTNLALIKSYIGDYTPSQN